MTTYWWLRGTTGTRTPTIRAISAAKMPPQSTTVAHETSPRSVRTRTTRPRSASMPSTRVCRCTATPALRAWVASAWQSWDGSTCPSEPR